MRKTPPVVRRIVTANQGLRAHRGHVGQPASMEHQDYQEKPVFQVTQAYPVTKAIREVPARKAIKDPNSSSTKMPPSTHPGPAEVRRANGGPAEGAENRAPSDHRADRPARATWVPTRGRDDRDRKEIKDQKETWGPAEKKANAAETEWTAGPVHRVFQRHPGTAFSTFQCRVPQGHLVHRDHRAYREFP